MRADDYTPGQATSSAPIAPDDRRPLDAANLRRAVVRPGGFWHALDIVDRTGSTNADLLARASQGAPEGLVLAAEEQSAGRGRMGRAWVSPPRAALTFSLLVRPAAVPPARHGWLSLLTGVAVASAVTAVTGIDLRLKWPNDLLAGPAKLGGILAEAAGDAIVVGVGLNVSTEPAELPPPGHPCWADAKREYEAGLAEFEKRNFHLAARILANLRGKCPDDGPALLLLSRVVNGMVQEPVPVDLIWELPGK